MSYPRGGYSPYGPDPWPQTSWDWRAAGNFICGGAGCGLIVAAALSTAAGGALAMPMLAGLALVGLGLFSVSLELGRPLRAPNVLRNPRTSWMAREAWTSMLLFPAGVAAAWGIAGLPWVAAALALLFVYCQARLVQGAKGIPAWRAPLLVPLVVTTGLAEGFGLYCAGAPWHHAGASWLVAAFGALVLLRMIVWHAYRRSVAASLAPGAAAALDHAGKTLQFAGTLVPLLLVVAIAAGIVAGAAAEWSAALAGVFAAGAGAYTKFTIVTRAGFNQGFALARMPVRGVRRRVA